MFTERFLTIYSGVLTAVFAVIVLSDMSAPPKKTTLEEINVRRHASATQARSRADASGWLRMSS